MAGFTPFTSNYTDLSDENGYQFEFRCDICGSGYRSEFIRSNVGTAGTILSGASGILGGLWGASRAVDTVHDVVNRGARDDALKKASEELMKFFQRCPRCSNWVDETCWNDQRGLCANCAPKLASEMEATRSQVEIQQMREAMNQERVFSGDTSARATVCPGCGRPAGAEKFCSNCGTPLGTPKCPQCGAEMVAGARFCGNCGARTGG